MPDATDNCPLHANPDQANAQEVDEGQEPDGLGDACDPRPRRSGDVVHRQWDFSESSQLDGVIVGGDWTVVDGSLVQTGEAIARVAWPIPFTGPYVVDARVRFLAYLGMPNHIIGIVGGLDGAEDGMMCSLDRQDTGAPMFYALREVDAGVGLNVIQSGGLNILPLGTPALLRARFSPTDARCSANGSAEVSTALSMGTFPGSVALRTVRADAAYDHVVIYELGN